MSSLTKKRKLRYEMGALAYGEGTCTTWDDYYKEALAETDPEERAASAYEMVCNGAMNVRQATLTQVREAVVHLDADGMLAAIDALIEESKP